MSHGGSERTGIVVNRVSSHARLVFPAKRCSILGWVLLYVHMYLFLGSYRVLHRSFV